MEQRNMILAFALSMLVLLGWSAIFPPEEPTQQNTPQQIEQTKAGETSVDTFNPAPPMVNLNTEPTLVDSEGAYPVSVQANQTNKRASFNLESDLLKVTVDDSGRIMSALLPAYRQSLEEDLGPVMVLGEKEPHAMFISSGLMNHAKVLSPFIQVNHGVITDNRTEIMLKAELEGGGTWFRKLSIDSGSYQLSIEDRVTKSSGVKMYHQVVERYPNRDDSTFYEFAGPVGLSGEELQEMSYENLDELKKHEYLAVGGWVGIMDRYFITAIYGDQAEDYRYYYIGDGRTYQAGIIENGKPDGDSTQFNSTVYVGPKSIEVMKTLDIGLERSVDFGWFAFIAKPLHDALSWFHGYIPNYGWCIILLVLVIKIIFLWPTQKSYQSMAAMRKLQPEQKRLQERYSDDRQKLGQEMMALYKKNKVNPLGGCLPILIQIPVFFSLYKVLLMSIEMRHAPFIGWITDLSAQDPFFVLPLLMGASMYIQQKLNPQPPDPMQAKIMSFLPVLFTVMFLFFPAGLVLYWVVNNVLSIVQQRLVMKRMGVD
ncbi:MAG: membrane protein insertase YidC [Mariprofundaceae bacterium]